MKITLPMAIFLILLTLKLAGIGMVATWSWWWIFLPIWFPLVVIIFAIIGKLVIKILEDN